MADERKGRLTRSRNEWSPAVDIPPPAVQAAAVVAAVDVHSACIRAVRLRWRRQAGKGVDRQSDLPTDETTEARLSKQRTNGRVDGRATVRTELAKQYCRERASERARGLGWNEQSRRRRTTTTIIHTWGGRAEGKGGGGGDILRADINQTDIASKDTAADSSEARRRRSDPE